MKESTRVLVALAAAIGGGALIAASGSKALIEAADALAPVGTLWVNAIRMTVIPLVVSLLITGVVSAADLGAIGRIGGRTLVVFGLLLAAIAAIVVPLASALFALLLFVRCVWLAAPAAVFAPVLPIAAHLGGAVAGAIGVYIAAYSLACVAVILLIYPALAVFGGVGIGRFARAALPAQLIAFSS